MPLCFLHCLQSCAYDAQAVAAVNAFNGEEIAGRKILVREDREDRDVKQFNKENGIERPNTRRPKRGGRGGVANGSARGDQGGRRGTPQETHQSSGLQASLFLIDESKKRNKASPIWQACCDSLKSRL